MYIQEPLIASGSEYYIYSPGRLARSLYFCPLSADSYCYRPGYAVTRNQFDSYLVMYIEEGSCKIENCAFSGTANEGEFVFLDCYQPHSYRSRDGWKALWLHFDGPLAKTYFQEISTRKGQIFSLSDPSALLSLEKILGFFRTSASISEPELSRDKSLLLSQTLCLRNRLHPAPVSDQHKDQRSKVSPQVP